MLKILNVKIFRPSKVFLYRNNAPRIHYSQRSTIVITRQRRNRFSPSEHLWPILPLEKEKEAYMAELYDQKYGNLPREHDIDQLVGTLNLNTSASAPIRRSFANLKGQELLGSFREALGVQTPEMVWFMYESICSNDLQGSLTADDLHLLCKSLYELPLPDASTKILSVLTALKTLNEDITISDYNCLLSVFYVAGDLESIDAQYKLLKSEGLEPDVTTFKYLLKAFGVMRGSQDMSLLYLDYLIRKENAPVDAVLVAEILRQLNADGFHNQVLGWFDPQKKQRHRGVVRKFVPNADCFRQVFRACVLSGFPERMFEFYDRMESEFSVEPDRGCLEYALEIALTRPNLTHRAPEIASKLRQSGFKPDADSFAGYMSILTRSGRSEDALHVFKEMVKHGITPSRKTWTSLMRALADLRSLDRVLVLYEELLQYGLPPDQHMFVTLIYSCGCGGAPDSIDAMLRLIREHGARSDIVAYHSAMDAYCRRELTEKAWYVFEQLVEMGFRPTPRTYHTLLKIYGAQNMYGAAEDVIEIMKRDQMRPTALTYAIYGRFLLKAGMFLRLESLYKTMQTEFRDEPLFQPAFKQHRSAAEFFAPGNVPGQPKEYRRGPNRGNIRRDFALFEEYLFSLPRSLIDIEAIPGMNINYL